MSFASFSATLTSGIQEVSALLPIIGTEQCEKHIGSALEGGYIYAAATPLSIFGSLGIVKNGLSILVASISIPKPSLSFSSFLSLSQTGQRWLGARLLSNAGFAPVGTVAPLIGMDKKRYRAETRLLEILEEKHIHAPENVLVQWKSRQWNIHLISCTLLAGALGMAPYVHLIPETSIPLPWIYPMIRVLGSCLATISIQFLIQCRVVSLMKSRIVFMTMNRLHSNDLTTILETSYTNFRWDESLPAEECLAGLGRSLGLYRKAVEGGLAALPVPGTFHQETSALMGAIAHVLKGLDAQHAIHFPNPTRHHLFVLSSWILLLISIPAAVIGYVGCFTLVSNSKPNAPLVWLGVEASLAVLRILLWAWNPKFDEHTEVTVQLKLSEHLPLVTTDKDVDLICSPDGALDLTPEWSFLERITPYTGPLEQFDSPPNTVLYFTLTGFQAEHSQRKGLFLFMTAFDLSNRTAFSVRRGEDNRLRYHHVVVAQNSDTGEMQASLASEIDIYRPRQTNHSVQLVKQLSDYYVRLSYALNNRRASAVLPQKWSLLPKLTRFENQIQTSTTVKPLPSHSQLYLQRGYEHHLKTKLTQNWGKWICDVMEIIHLNARNDCIHALADPSGKLAKWELAELDTRLLWERTRRELVLIHLSIELEDHLHTRMLAYVDKVSQECGDTIKQFWHWPSSEFGIGQKKRLEREGKEAKKRMEEARKASDKQAEKEGRPYDDELWFDNVTEQWAQAQKFIEEVWATVMEKSALAGRVGRWRIEPVLDDSTSKFKRLVEQQIPQVENLDDEGRRRLGFVKELQHRFTRWNDPHREKGHEEMVDTIKRIKQAEFGQLDEAYYYPNSSSQLAAAVHAKFANLGALSQTSERAFAARLSSAIVYNVAYCDADIVRDVLQKSHVRSVINLPKHLHPSIPPNDHLLHIHPSPDVVSPVTNENHGRWWNQQNSNSWTFCFSAEYMDTNGRYLYNYGGTIAHIMIFIQTPVHLRLRLLHLRKGEASVWIQEGHRKLYFIRPDDIAEDTVRLQDFELDAVFNQGRHELELVVQESQSVQYGLCDIQVEFDAPS